MESFKREITRAVPIHISRPDMIPMDTDHEFTRSSITRRVNDIKKIIEKVIIDSSDLSQKDSVFNDKLEIELYIYIKFMMDEFGLCTVFWDDIFIDFMVWFPVSYIRSRYESRLDYKARIDFIPISMLDREFKMFIKRLDKDKQKLKDSIVSKKKHAFFLHCSLGLGFENVICASSDPNNACAICTKTFVKGNDIMITKCDQVNKDGKLITARHSFHKICLFDWFAVDSKEHQTVEHNAKCPCCKTEFFAC